jgi:SWIM zinc finger
MFMSAQHQGSEIIMSHDFRIDSATPAVLDLDETSALLALSEPSAVLLLTKAGFSHPSAQDGFNLALSGRVLYHRPGVYAVQSMTDPHRVYFCSRDLCTCPAGQYDRLCKHRAGVLLVEATITVTL